MVVWITGASSGIGAHLAREMNRQGAHVILSARNADALRQAQRHLPQAEVPSFVLPLDLEDHGSLAEKVQIALSNFGHIDCLVHNAGVGIRDFALQTDYTVDRKLMDINYFGPVVLTKEVLPHMLHRGQGQLVVVSSLSGKYGVPRTAAYAASKHALHGFFETLRSEIAGQGVAITILVPGIIQTDITAHALKGDGSRFGRVEQTFRKAYPVEKAARRMAAAIHRKREEVFIGGAEGFTLLLQRLSPWLLRRFIRNHPIKRLRRLKRWIRLQSHADAVD